MHPFAKVSISYRLQREHECSTHTCPEEKRDILQRGHWLSQLGLHVDVVEVLPSLPAHPAARGPWGLGCRRRQE